MTQILQLIHWLWSLNQADLQRTCGEPVNERLLSLLVLPDTVDQSHVKKVSCSASVQVAGSNNRTLVSLITCTSGYREQFFSTDVTPLLCQPSREQIEIETKYS